MTAYVITPEMRAEGLSASAWPGGYTIVYLSAKDEVLCAKCANTLGPDDFAPGMATCYGEHAEGRPLDCEGCGAVIESSYGLTDDELYEDYQAACEAENLEPHNRQAWEIHGKMEGPI